LTAVNEDTAAPTGALVSALFASNFSDSTDAVAGGSSANTLAGVAITANAAGSTQGTWQWQASGTSIWTNIATAGLLDTNALYLAANTTLRFVPAANFNGPIGALTARLVDSSASGLTNGATTDVSTNGGISAYIRCCTSVQHRHCQRRRSKSKHNFAGIPSLWVGRW
jgi:hypothetical protein